MADQFTDLHHLLGVQPHGGFIQDDDLRKAQNGLGQAHPLAVALGQVPDQPGAHLLQVGQSQHLVQLLLLLLSGDPLQLCAEGQILLHGHVRIQRRQFRQIPDTGLGSLRLLQNVVALHQDLTAGGGQITRHDIHRSGLSGAVWAQKAEDLAIFHGEAQMVHRIAVSIALHQISYFDHANDLLFGKRQAPPPRRHQYRGRI